MRAGALSAARGGNTEARSDLFDLLELLVEHRVLTRVDAPSTSGGGGDADAGTDMDAESKHQPRRKRKR